MKVINSYKILFLILLIFSFVLDLEAGETRSTRAQKKRSLILWIKKRAEQLLPEDLYKYGYKKIVINRTKIGFSSKRCIKLLRATTDENKYTYRMVVSRTCLRNLEKDFTPRFIEAVVEVWSKQLRSKYYDKKLREIIFRNNFYYLNWFDFKLNFNQELPKVYLEFWKIAFRESLLFPETFSINSYLVKFLVKKFKFKENKFCYFYIDPSDYDLKTFNRAKIKFIEKANEAFFIRYEMIKKAKHSIYIQYFSWFDDVFGLALLELIVRKAEEGVKIYFMVDGRGHSLPYEYLNLLATKGVNVRIFNELNFFSLGNIWKPFVAGLVDAFVASNHDKLLLVDKKIFLTGGRNIGARYFVLPEEEKRGKVYRDSDIYVEFKREAISVIKAFSLEFWSPNVKIIRPKKKTEFVRNKIRKKLSDSLGALESRMNNVNLISSSSFYQYQELVDYVSISDYRFWKYPTPQTEVDIRGLDNSSALGDIKELNKVLYEEIDKTKHSLYIQNPYLTFTKKFRKAIVRAAKRGVEIVISVPTSKTTDIYISLGPLYNSWKKVIGKYSNIRMYGYVGDGDLHSKIFVFDRRKTLIGSYNLDSLSEKIDSEFSTLVTSKELSEDIINIIEDIVESESISFDDLKYGPLLTQETRSSKRKFLVLSFLARIISPWI